MRADRQWRPRAQSAAATRLTHEFWDRYRELYREEVDAGIARRPQTRAKTRLAHEHPARYRELYVEERDRLSQLPGPQRYSVHLPGVHRRSG